MCPAFHAGEKARQARPTSVEAGGADPDAFGPHEPLHPTAPDLLAVALQGGVDARAAIGLAAVAVDRANLLDKHGIVDGASARWPVHPGVVARRTDPDIRHIAFTGYASWWCSMKAKMSAFEPK